MDNNTNEQQQPQFIISNHAKERYVERVKDKDEKSTIAVYVAQHEEMICKDINKMLEYAKLIYTGPSQSVSSKEIIDVYINGLWTIIVSHSKNVVLTLYSLDLGIDDETNQIVAGKLKDRVDQANEELANVKETVSKEIAGYKDKIQQNEDAISNYRKLIQDLEKENEAIKSMITALQADINVADSKVRELVHKLIGKKSF